MAQNIRLAWKQLTFERMKLMTAVAGVMVAVMLMWVQLGILASVYKSATVVHRNINADLIVIHKLTETMNQSKLFSSRTLYRAYGHPDVVEIGEMLVSPVTWRNPDNGTQWQIQCYGLDPEGHWLNIVGLEDHASALRETDTFLYDKRSRNVFGNVVPAFERGERVELELNRRNSRMIGTTEMAASFGQMGNIITTRENYLRLHTNQIAEQLHMGMIRLKPGIDPITVRNELNQEFDPEAMVLTQSEFSDFELRYWKSNAPVGFIFTLGTIIGFFIGFIVVYQILYTDVTNHLPYYATMKAMGFSDWFLLRIVIREGLILSIVGYIPGTMLAIGFYKAVQLATGIPVEATWERGWFLLGLTFVMCFLSGAMATRKLRSADPADVF